MDERLYQHHVTVTGWMSNFEERCQDHFTWLEEVLQVAAENYQKRDVEVLPKTPSVKKKTRRRKPPIVMSSEDEDFVETEVIKKPKGRQTRINDSSAEESAEAAEDQSKSKKSTRSTRSTRSTKSNSDSAKSTRSTRKKKVAIDTSVDDPSPNVMESISELDEGDVEEKVIKNPASNLFKVAEETLIEEKSDGEDVVMKNKKVESCARVPSPAVAPPLAKSPVVKTTPVAKIVSQPLNASLHLLKKTLTPVSPRVQLEPLKMSDENSFENVDSECAMDTDHDGSFTKVNVKDKVRAYDDLINKLSPALNRSVTLTPTDANPQAQSVYTSILNVTLSSERLPAKTRVIRQISNSPQPKRLSRKSSISTRKSDRIQQQASRMSLSKRKSFLMKNRASLLQSEITVKVIAETSTPKATKASTPKVPRPRTALKQSPVVQCSSSRKRQLVTDSDSSHSGTPTVKRVRSERMAQSPRVKSLKKPQDKSSDSEYVTDDSDVPPSPVSSKYRTPTRTLMKKANTPQSRSPAMNGSFIKRNTPKALTIKERQEVYKKELAQKRQQEERRLEKIRHQKQQELEKIKRKREERHQQVQAKRLAQQKAANEQSMTSVKSKEKRGSAIIREQREKAEVERQKRIKKQAEAEERRRQEEEKRLQKLREKEEEAKMIQAMMQRKKEYEEQERQRRIQEEKRKALEEKQRLEKQRQAEEKQRQEEKKRQQEAEIKRQREEAEKAKAAQAAQNVSLNSSQLNKSLADTYRKDELQSYNIDDIRSDDETDDEDAPKKEIPPWALGHRMKASMIHQHYKPPNLDEIFPPSVLLLAPDLALIFPTKHRPRFNKRTSSAVWSPIQKHFIKKT